MKGFYEGVFTVGKYKGKLIKDYKNNIKQEMIENNEACLYYEPEDLVISRSQGEKLQNKKKLIYLKI